MIEDKTWQPDMVESTRTSLYSLADALRRRPRRTTGQHTSRAVRSDHDRLSPAKAMLSKPISKAKRRTGFLHIKRNVERAILNHGDAMLRFVEGDGTADARQNPPLHQLNHDRRRRRFIGAVERLRAASAQAGHASTGPILNASTSGAPDQGIRRKHIEYWPTSKEIILSMRTFTAGLHNKLIGSEVDRAHMSTYINQETDAQGDEYWVEETPDYEIQSIPHVLHPSSASGVDRNSDTCYPPGHPRVGTPPERWHRTSKHSNRSAETG